VGTAITNTLFDVFFLRRNSTTHVWADEDPGVWLSRVRLHSVRRTPTTQVLREIQGYWG
jgi:hypothetical protein